MGGSRYLYGSRVDPGKRTSRFGVLILMSIGSLTLLLGTVMPIKPVDGV